MCCLFCLSWILFEKKSSSKCAVRCTVFWTKNIPSAPYVCTVCPWEATTDTTEITGIPPHINLLTKIESLKWIIQYLKAYVTRDMKGVLKDKLDIRDIGGTGFWSRKYNFFQGLTKSSLTIRSQQTRALVKGKTRFYILLKTEFLLRMTFWSSSRKEEIMITVLQLENPETLFHRLRHMHQSYEIEGNIS